MSDKYAALSEKCELIISQMKDRHKDVAIYAPVMTWSEFESLLAERDADKARIAELEAQASTHDRLCDSNYLAGMTVGWNFGIIEDSDGFDQCHAARARRWPDSDISLKIEGE